MPKAIDITNQKFGKLTAIQKSESRGGKTYWLCKCECGNEKEVQTSHLRNGSIQSCGKCQHKTHKVVAFRQRVKIALVEASGHKCAYCGLVDHPAIYDFHHINPATKEFGLGNGATTRSKKAYAEEAKKCVMLCSNCHRRIENNLISIKDLDIIPFDEDIYYQAIEDLIK